MSEIINIQLLPPNLLMIDHVKSHCQTLMIAVVFMYKKIYANNELKYILILFIYGRDMAILGKDINSY